ncbi:MAG: DUF2442 domain-containing protein [Bacteroidales bacterium]|nr:DUF2442 domain-containing protein [Bacteroidales bacterium]
MFLEIVKAEYRSSYRIRLWFNTGDVREVNLEDSLQGSVFEPLKDIQEFQKFHIRFNTIEWDNGADFSPEYLFDRGTAVYDTTSNPLPQVADDVLPYNTRS